MVVIEVIKSIGLTGWLIFCIMVLAFVTFVALKWLNNSVGFRFAWTLYKLKNNPMNKGRMLLRVLIPTGIPQFKIVDVTNTIEYKYKENGKDKVGLVIYDHRCVYESFAGLKTLDCRPDDIFPVNPYASTSMTLSGDVVKKNLVDTSKQDFKGQEVKAWLKLAMPIILVGGIIIILYSSNQSEALQICYQQVASLSSTVANSQPATIIGG